MSPSSSRLTCYLLETSEKGEPSPVPKSHGVNLLHIPKRAPTPWKVGHDTLWLYRIEWKRDSSPIENYLKRVTGFQTTPPVGALFETEVSFLLPEAPFLVDKHLVSGLNYRCPLNSQLETESAFLKVKQWGRFLRNFKRNTFSPTPCLNLIFYISIRNNF